MSCYTTYYAKNRATVMIEKILPCKMGQKCMRSISNQLQIKPLLGRTSKQFCFLQFLEQILKMRENLTNDRHCARSVQNCSEKHKALNRRKKHHTHTLTHTHPTIPRNNQTREEKHAVTKQKPPQRSRTNRDGTGETFLMCETTHWLKSLIGVHELPL